MHVLSRSSKISIAAALATSTTFFPVLVSSLTKQLTESLFKRVLPFRLRTDSRRFWKSGVSLPPASSSSSSSSLLRSSFPMMPSPRDDKESNINIPSDEKQSLLLESRQAFINWAKDNAVPIKLPQHITKTTDDDDDDDALLFFQTLSQAIKKSSASVVLLSEGYHNCKEMMMLHHRIIQYLVTHDGFRLIASESGMPESRGVADYILPVEYMRPVQYSSDDDEAKDDNALWRSSLNKMYSSWVEGRDLIEWIKLYNSNKVKEVVKQQQQQQEPSQMDVLETNDDLVHYCGLDIGGFYANWNRPISKIQHYLKSKFPTFEQEWSKRIYPLLEIMGDTNARYNYQHLMTPAQKSTLAVLLDELVAKMNSHKEELGGELDFEWARQSAISMQLAENYYRNYENMLLQSTDGSSRSASISKYTGLNGREIAMAHTLMWRMNLERRSSMLRDKNESIDRKAIVINHLVHTKTATQYQDGVWGHFVPMGQLMKRLFLTECNDIDTKKKVMFNIGMIYGGGTFWNKWQRPQERFIDTIPPPKQHPSDEDGLEIVMKHISQESGLPNYFLHWEKAPKEAWLYLNEITTIRENDYFIRAYPLEWNGCIYLDQVSHATPA